jgi:hypothetical protein
MEKSHDFWNTDYITLSSLVPILVNISPSKTTAPVQATKSQKQDPKGSKYFKVTRLYPKTKARDTYRNTKICNTNQIY